MKPKQNQYLKLLAGHFFGPICLGRCHCDLCFTVCLLCVNFVVGLFSVFCFDAINSKFQMSLCPLEPLQFHAANFGAR